ncbi:MAG: UDP-N-acetylmuramoyl-tripeptide--D-alanyl-D-alanine ligase [Actinomycetota bacterium]|nr:UDP-N-acetylmuramoyl-tripeptide--D-alanyl-D-alanine ligase [Actinomycetota bacterium]
MIALTIGEIAAMVGGRVVGADPSTVVHGSVEFDSRLVTSGGLFVALPGENCDGHDFACAAAEAGAVAAIVTRPVDGPCIVVPDGFRAMADLAAAVLRRLPNLTIVGITGSSGKTSTKDMLAQLLAHAGPTVAPPGSFNNELGHPYTALRADESTRFLVLELSARGLGHIRFLAGIAPPRIGVELNVGSAHLGEFGSRDAIAAAKGELVEALPPAAAGGVAVLNADDPLVLAMARRTGARIVTVGVSASADIRADNISLDDLGRPAFTIHVGPRSAWVQLGFAGAHHVGNALSSLAVSLECGLGLDEAVAALAAATPSSRWRMELTLRADDVLVINDAYNANPESMRAALVSLAAVATTRKVRGGRSFAVLGTMAELGAETQDEHRAIGRFAAQLDVSRVIAIGEPARAVLAGAEADHCWRGTASWAPDVHEAIKILRAQLHPGDVVLVKASRAASLERVALAILDDSPQAVTDGDVTGGGQA